MSATSFYVRSRGKISGPFDLAALQKLVRRGALSRMHEVSSDRLTWSQAAEFVDLFPARSSATQVQEPSAAEQVAQNAGPPPGMYFYAQNGVTVGPVPLSVLQSLAQTGTLGPQDVCWQEGAQIAVRATQFPALASIFSGLGEATSGSTRQEQADRQRNLPKLEKIYGICQVAGVVMGSILVLCLNLPIGSVKSTGKIIWWWDVLRLPNAGTATVLLFFILFAGLSIGAIGATLRGLVRAWIFIGVAILSFLLFLVAGLTELSANAELIFLLFLPYLAAALIGVSCFRPMAPKFRIGAIFQGILGGTLLFAAIVVSILCLAENVPSEIRESFGSDPLPEWAVMAMTCSAIGLAASLIAGILGLVGVKPTFSQGANWATVGCAGASIVLPFIATMTAVYGLARAASVEKFDATLPPGVVIFLFFRIGAAFCAFLALLAFGLTELFLASCFTRFAPPNPTTLSTGSRDATA